MLENFKKSVDDGNEFGALSTDLSKASDCIDHKPLIVKLFCSGVSPTAINSIHSTYQTELKELRLIIASVDDVAQNTAFRKVQSQVHCYLIMT